MKKTLLLVLILAMLCVTLTGCEWVKLGNNAFSIFSRFFPDLVGCPPHSLIDMEDVEATCITEGKIGGEICKKCNVIVVQQQPTPALGHDYDNDTDTTCNRCDYVRLPLVCAHNNSVVLLRAIEATCIAEGRTAGSQCADCGEILSGYEVLPVVPHTYDGDADTTCNICSHVRPTGPCAHEKKVEYPAVEPTCTATGMTACSYCASCSKWLVPQTVVPAKGHTPVTVPAKAPTCTAEGLSEGSRCADCYSIFTAQETIPALGHAEVNHSAKEPTCTEIGWDAYETCSRCDYTTCVKKSAMGHATVSHVAKDPTCIEVGWDAYETCSRCDYTTYTEKPTIDHNFIYGYCYGCDKLHSKGLSFTSNGDGTCYVRGIGNCTDTDIVIPPVSRAGALVTSIGSNAFDGCDSLTSIVIPASVTSIGSHAFWDCAALTTVTFAEGSHCTDIVEWAFSGCSSLASIVIPTGVTRIGNHAFEDCALLTLITIPASVISIREMAFVGCGALTIYCEAAESPSGWNSDWSGYQGPSVVWDCNNNDVATDGYVYTVIDGVRYALKNGSATVAQQPNNITTANIPATVSYKGTIYSVTSIGKKAFYNCTTLTSIVIPECVTSIGQYAFYDCSSLTSIVIPESVTSIDSYAFYKCTALTIYCEAASKPIGWNNNWNYSNRPVVWGYIGERR